GPDDAGPARTLSAVWIRPAQGIQHRRPRSGPDRARAEPGAPVFVREREPGGGITRPRHPAGPDGRRGPGGRRGTGGPRPDPGPSRPDGCIRGEREENELMSAEDLEKYEAEMELQLYREYRDVAGFFPPWVQPR